MLDDVPKLGHLALEDDEDEEEDEDDVECV